MSNPLKAKSVPIQSSEITPEHVYLNRRQFMQVAGAAGATALLAAACGPAACSRANLLPRRTI